MTTVEKRGKLDFTFKFRLGILSQQKKTFLMLEKPIYFYVSKILYSKYFVASNIEIEFLMKDD